MPPERLDALVERADPLAQIREQRGDVRNLAPLHDGRTYRMAARGASDGASRLAPAPRERVEGFPDDPGSGVRLGWSGRWDLRARARAASRLGLPGGGAGRRLGERLDRVAGPPGGRIAARRAPR